MSDVIVNARRLAMQYHEGQFYGTVPYWEHLEAVVESLQQKYSYVSPESAELFATAWLHDILEDTECNPSEISDACGPTVMLAVLNLSKRSGQGYEHYIKMVKACPIALEVKLHDSLANLTASVMSGEKGRIRKYIKQLQLLVEPS